MDALAVALRQHHPERTPPRLIKAPEVQIVPEPRKTIEPPKEQWFERVAAYRPEGIRFNRGRVSGTFGLESFGEDRSIPATTMNIIRQVAKFYGVSPVDLVSSRRTKHIMEPRQVAMYLAKTLTLRSLPEVGRRMGGRDHTTILHGVRKIAAKIQKDAELAAKVEALAERFRVPA